MLRYHMAVITSDNALKRAIKRVTTATGSTADFIGDISGLTPKKPVDLVIFDARTDEPDKLFFAKVPVKAKIIYIIPGDSLIQRMTSLKDPRVTSLFCHDERFDEDEFIATCTKGLRGEVFGLQKYFPWGVTSFSMIVNNYEEKGRAVDVLLRYAKLAGVRGPVRDRIQLVADELMMNALYHAPVDADGKEVYSGRTLKELAQLDQVNAIQVQYGCSGRYFGISVRDAGGSLTRVRALEYLVRAKTGAKIEDKTSGAGLGLISVLRSVSKLVFNLEPGGSTEVIGLFDMELFARGKVGARSLHLFAEDPPEPEAEEPEAAPRTSASGIGNSGKWAVAAVLMAVVSAMATAYYFRQAAPANAHAAANQSRTLTVDPTPPDAKIIFNGQEVRAGVQLEIPEPPANPVVQVSKDGFEPASYQVREDQAGHLRWTVNLAKK